MRNLRRSGRRIIQGRKEQPLLTLQCGRSRSSSTDGSPAIPPLRLVSAAKGGAGRRLIREQPTSTVARHLTQLTKTPRHPVRVHTPHKRTLELLLAFTRLGKQ
jgi:hypothetical protein